MRSPLLHPPAPSSPPPLQGVRVLRFHAVEDRAFPPDPAVCAQAPFTPNLRKGASLWALPSYAGDGAVHGGVARWIGTATECGRVTDCEPGGSQEFYAVFDLAEGRVAGRGACTLVSNDVPVEGLVLAACHLRITQAPPGYHGGIATSLSVFNPQGIEGYASGSFWTLQLFASAE